MLEVLPLKLLERIAAAELHENRPNIVMPGGCDGEPHGSI